MSKREKSVYSIFNERFCQTFEPTAYVVYATHRRDNIYLVSYPRSAVFAFETLESRSRFYYRFGIIRLILILHAFV